jgi:hypothetical protein
MGTPVKVIEVTEGWIRVQTPDGYNGWIDESGIKRLSAEEIEVWKSSNRYLFNSITGYVYSAPNPKSQIISDLVLDDIFVVEETKSSYLKIHTPDGRRGYVRKKECIRWSDWIDKKPNNKEFLSIPMKMVGSPYLWGGTSIKAVDCSGLVKIASLSQAIIIERDASQQEQCGDSVDFRNRNNLQPGDLLFFGPSPENIIHVGIYIGNGEYVHSSGYVRINSIDPTAQHYNLTAAKNLQSARRIMNSLNTEGIAQVKYHPWYNHYIP